MKEDEPKKLSLRERIAIEVAENEKTPAKKLEEAGKKKRLEQPKTEPSP